jgi:hypothetical protein
MKNALIFSLPFWMIAIGLWIGAIKINYIVPSPISKYSVCEWNINGQNPFTVNAEMTDIEQGKGAMFCLPK